MTNPFAHLHTLELTTYYGNRKDDTFKTRLLIHQGDTYIEIDNTEVPILIKALTKFLALNPIEN
jgi:hypothetical protein